MYIVDAGDKVYKVDADSYKMDDYGKATFYKDGKAVAFISYPSSILKQGETSVERVYAKNPGQIL